MIEYFKEFLASSVLVLSPEEVINLTPETAIKVITTTIAIFQKKPIAEFVASKMLLLLPKFKSFSPNCFSTIGAPT